MQKLISLTLIISALTQTLFLYLFVARNAPGLSNVTVVATMAIIYGALFALTTKHLLEALWRGAGRPKSRYANLFLRGIIVLMAFALLAAFTDATLTDYYQPLSLYDDAIATLALSWGTLCIALVLIALSSTIGQLPQQRGVKLAAVALLGWPLAASLHWVNQPTPHDALNLHREVFVGGVDGYDIYRIPALLVLHRGSKLADGSILNEDKLLAFAEARRYGALDTGVIDLVMKSSNDGGQSWDAQRVVCTNVQGNRRGKCGNATPVFDQQTGTVHLAYNLSNSHEHEMRIHSSMVAQSKDGGETWSSPREIAADNLVFGPGHGIQKQQPPHKGRLLLPAYLGEHAIALYSDDSGETWQRGEKLDTGNESEIAELPDGSLYLTTRHRAPIGRPPKPNGRLFSISVDGGKHWSATATDTQLPTPICQASLSVHNDSRGLLFSNPAHTKSRVNMTIRFSPDNGETWPSRLAIYPGPAGYSDLGEATSGDIFLLYEHGNMSYSERISFASLPVDALSEN